MPPEVPRWDDRHTDALVHAWRAHRTYAAAARDRKGEIVRWRRVVLGLTIGGAVLGGLATGADAMDLSFASRALAVTAGILVALAGFFTKEVLSSEREARWLRARAAAERIKSDVFRFRAGASPFDTAEAPAVLMNHLIDREADAPAVSPVSGIASDAPATPLSIDDYLRDRVDDQVGFYHRRAADYERTLERGRWASLGLGAIAVVLGGVGALAWAGAAVAVITTATASLATYLYAHRYKDLRVRYLAAARELEALRRRWTVAERHDETEAKTLVAACEDALLRENEGWLALGLGAAEPPVNVPRGE